MLRVLRTLCHPLQQSRFMSGGAKRSSLNQRFHEIKIDSFLDIWIDGWIYLSIQISFAISPKSLIWPGNKALLWAQEAKGMSSAASPPHFFISLCPFRMRFARHWRFACSPLISSLDGSSDGLRRSFPTKMERAVSHRDVDSFSAPNEMGN